MKKILYFIVALALCTGCTEGNKHEDDGLLHQTLTFEGAEWDALVDNPQYGGALLYGDGYSWYDATTDLYSELTNSWGDNQFWGGGVALSNYFSLDYAANASYEQQLTVYAEGAHSGKNCVVCNGYKSSYGDSRPQICFRSGAGYIESAYICLTAYSYAMVKVGNAYTQPLGAEEWVKVVATGYDENDAEGSSVEIYLYKDGAPAINGWTKWELKSLGEVHKVCFDVQWSGSADTFSLPAYFALDDIAVAKQKQQ